MWTRANDPEVVERLRRLVKNILRRCSPEEIVACGGDWQLICAWPYGDLYVLEAVWKQLYIDSVVRQQASARQFGFDLERALFALVAKHACTPVSKLYYPEQWLREDVHIRGTQDLKLHQLYASPSVPIEAAKAHVLHNLPSGAAIQWSQSPNYSNATTYGRLKRHALPVPAGLQRQHFGRFFAKLTDDAHRYPLSRDDGDGVRDEAVEAFEGFVVDFYFEGALGGPFGRGSGQR
ncbi:MAG: hypothetical protein K9J77_08695, partial [Rhodoferax sp.]|nr:hypothetical protein [Rhodoferax sp.]